VKPPCKIFSLRATEVSQGTTENLTLYDPPTLKNLIFFIPTFIEKEDRGLVIDLITLSGNGHGLG
jgi:hypothetical protein